MLPTTAFASENIQDSGTTIETSGLCEHYAEHTADCGYIEETAQIPCGHEHTGDCYTETTSCIHTHTGDCYPVLDSSVSYNEAIPLDTAEPTCGHVCDLKSGCITQELDCKHEHSDECGYTPATEGIPCGFVCEICSAPVEQLISAWIFVDEDGNLVDSVLALPGASESNPATFEVILSLLPTEIIAITTDGEISLDLSWSCKNYPTNGAYSGNYTFTAALPEGYTLTETTAALCVVVELGNADLHSETEINTEVQYYDGHAYQYINDWVSWSEAKSACEALGGHLVTITSAEEQSFCNSIWDGQPYWLGGTDEAEEGVWRWITDEEFTYTNWLRGEPSNDYGGTEHYLMMRDDTPKWDDRRENNDGGGVGCAYICEWDYIENTESDCFSAFVSGMPKLSADHAKVFLSFIGDNDSVQDSVVGNKFYNIMTGDVSEYNGDLLALKADILAMSYFVRAQNASKIESTVAASKDAAAATVAYAKTFAPSNGQISDADLGILSGYKSETEKKLQNGIIDFLNESMFYGRFGNSVDVALDNIDTAMTYYDAIGGAADTAEKFCNGVMTAVYGLKYASAKELNEAYTYFEGYINHRPYYDAKNDATFQYIMGTYLDLFESNTSLLDPMVTLCLILAPGNDGITNWEDAILHIEYWGEYLCSLERYINTTSLLTDGVVHLWDITVLVSNEQGEVFVEEICSTCGTKKIEQVPGHSHSWSQIYSYNDTHHWHDCENSVCSITDNAQKSGYSEHSFDHACDTTCNGGCGYTRTVPHSFSNDCDTDCNDGCGYIRTITHSYETTWSKDEGGHWYECSVCHDKKDSISHTPGAAATETTPQTCTVCGYEIKPVLGHSHQWGGLDF